MKVVDVSKEENAFKIKSIFLLPFIIICLLHIIGALFPGINTWGFNQWSVSNIYLSLLILLFSSILLFFAKSSFIIKVVDSFFSSLLTLSKKINKNLLLIITICVLFTIFFLFRFNAFIYGDSREVLVQGSESFNNIFINLSHYKLHFMSTFLFRITIILFDKFNISNADTLTTINITGGIIGIFAIYKLSQILKSNKYSQLFIIFTALSSSSILLFFGYIEYYTWANSFGLWSLYFTFLYINGKGGKFLPVFFSLMAMGFHLITTPYFMITLLVMFYNTNKNSFLFSIKFKHLNLIAIIGSFVIVGILELFKVTDIFVPLFSNSNRYMFFSIPHIIDLFNETVLVAPLGITFLLITFFIKRTTKEKITTIEQILTTLTLLTFLTSAWIDPELGAARDWDLLAIYGIPLSLLGAYRWIDLFKNEKHILAMILPVILIIIIHIIPDVIIKNNPKLAIQYLDHILWKDAHYQTDYKEAKRCLSWGYLLYKHDNEPDRAIKYFERRLSVLDKDFESAYHLGEIYFQKDFLDSSEVYYSKAVENDSSNIKYLKKLALVKSTLNKKDESIDLLRRIVQLEPDNPYFMYSFAVALSFTDQIDEALVNFKKAYQLDNNLLGALLTISEIYIYYQQYDSAYSYLTKAQIGNPNFIDIYPLLIKTQIALDKFSEALTSWELYQQLNPTAPELDELYKIIIEGLNK